MHSSDCGVALRAGLARWLALVVLVTTGACADTSASVDTGADGQADAGVDAQLPDPDAHVPPAPDGAASGGYGVYAHSAIRLFKIDPNTQAVTLVGAFGWPGGPDQMTDIAIDRSGRMIGISYSKVYEVDRQTVACTYLAPLGQTFNGLSFITPDGDPEGQEILVGTSQEGGVFEIDPTTGQATALGTFGNGLLSSGDLVSVRGFGTVATVKPLIAFTDLLARIDPATGAATVIGDTGFANIWGLGYWEDKVYGFTEDGRFLLIDPRSGAATQVSQHAGPWWGAGVTTSAPVIK